MRVARAAMRFLSVERGNEIRAAQLAQRRAEDVVERGHVTGEVRGQRDACAGPRDAMTLAHRRRRIGEVVDAEVGGDEVEARVGKRHRRASPSCSATFVRPYTASFAAPAPDRLRPDVDAGEMRRRAVRMRELEQRKAGAARDVESGDVRPQLEMLEQQRTESRAPERELVVGVFGVVGIGGDAAIARAIAVSDGRDAIASCRSGVAPAPFGLNWLENSVTESTANGADS